MPCFPFGHSLSLTEYMLNQQTQRLSYSRVMEVDNVTFTVSFVDCENVSFAVTCWDIPIGRNSWNWLWHGCQCWVWVRKKRMVLVSKQLVHISPFICIRPIVHLYCPENQGIIFTIGVNQERQAFCDGFSRCPRNSFYEFGLDFYFVCCLLKVGYHGKQLIQARSQKIWVFIM